jgi:hypothetical protein
MTMMHWTMVRYYRLNPAWAFPPLAVFFIWGDNSFGGEVLERHWWRLER